MATTKATLLGHRSATSFSDLTLSGDLTVNGTTTTLDTAVQNVDKLEIGASSTDYGAKINQASTGNILQLQDNGTDVMVVEDGGNIGIRTSNPGVTLDIHDANPAIDLYDTGTNGYCRIDANGANLTLHADKGGNGSSSTIKFGVDNSVKMTIDSSGNVGIGSSPTEHLSIEGSGSQSLSIYSTDTGSVGTAKTFIKMFGENTGGDKREQARISASPGHSASNAGQLIFSTNNSSNVMTQRMIIREDGNVGIGTSNPIGDLSIVDPTTNSGIEIQTEVTTDTNRITNYDRAENAYKKFRLDAEETAFHISGTERMLINTSGRFYLYTGNGSTSNYSASININQTNNLSYQRFIECVRNDNNLVGGIRRNDSANSLHFYSGSDRRIKTNIQDFVTPCLDKINQLRLVTYDLKGGGGSGLSIIAQELVNIFPDKVEQTDDGTGEDLPEGVQEWTISNDFTFELIKAIQELSAKVTALENA